MPGRKEPAGYAMMLVAVIAWGVSFIWLKMALSYLPPAGLAGLRFAIASMILLPIVLTRPNVRRALLDLPAWRIYAMIGVVGTFLPNLLQNYGLLHLDAGLSGVVQGMGPIYTALMAAFLLREPFGPPKILGALVAFGGTLLLSASLYGLGDASILGVLLITLSAVAYSVYTVSLRETLLRSFDPLALLAGTMIAGTVPLLLFSTATEGLGSMLTMDASQWGVVLALAIGPTLLAYACYVSALARLEASKAAAFIFLVPVVALALGVVYLGESPTSGQILYSLLIIGGVMLAESGGGFAAKGG